MWPELVQPITEKPMIKMDKETVKFNMECASQGTSIGNKIMPVWEESCWQLFTQPVEINIPCLIIGKAIRYGWKESVESTFIVSKI